MFEKARKYLSFVRDTNESQHRLEAALGEAVGQLSASRARIDELEGCVARLSVQLSEAAERQRSFAAEALYNQSFSSAAELARIATAPRFAPGARVLLCGNYGDANLGDELMLSTVVAHLRAHTNADITVMLMPRIDYDCLWLGDVHIIHAPNNAADAQHLADFFDAVIFGGGALIEDTFYSYAGPSSAYDEGSFGPVPYFESRGMRMGMSIGRVLVDVGGGFVAAGKPAFCLGLSATESRPVHRTFLEKLQRLIDGAARFSMRDAESVRTLESWGLRCDKVVCAEDLLFANDALAACAPAGGGAVPAIARAQEGGPARVALIVLCYGAPIERIARLIALVNDRFGGPGKVAIDLVPFYTGFFDDVDVLGCAVQASGAENAHVAPYTNDMAQLASFLGTCDLVVSERYHGCLMALSLGVPTAPLFNDAHPHYRIKMAHLLELFGGSLRDCLTVSALDRGEAAPDSLAVVEPDTSCLPALRARAACELAALDGALGQARGA